SPEKCRYYRSFRWCPETESNRRHADLQAVPNFGKSTRYEENRRQTALEKSTGYKAFVKPSRPESVKKNPDALAGAVGADRIEQANREGKYQNEEYRRRAEHATALAHAIGLAHPDDARQLM